MKNALKLGAIVILGFALISTASIWLYSTMDPHPETVILGW